MTWLPFARQATILVLVIALIGIAAAFLLQRSLIYPAPSNYPKSVPDGYQPVQTHTADGLRLKAAYRASREGKPTLVFFHGNGDSLAGADVATRTLVDMGYGALLVEYRGYGGNLGKPSEQGFYADGEAAIRWLAERRVATKDLVIIGNSIGSGAATEMALRHPVRALIIVSGFSSLPDVVSDLFPYLPLKWLVRDRFDSVAKLGRIKAPILLLHGDQDWQIRPAHCERLTRANPLAQKVIVKGVGHELAYRPEAQRAIIAWLTSHIGNV